MPNPIAKIYEFNEKAGFLGKGMDSFIETAYTLEEAIEGFEPAFNASREDGTVIVKGDADFLTARQWSLSLMNSIHEAFEQRNVPMPDEVDELDKAIDLVVFSIGKMAKMGLSQDQIAEAFDVVADANLSKIGAPKDALGKQLKPEGWIAPETKLQEILDRRVNESK